MGDNILEPAALLWGHGGQQERVDADKGLDNHPEVGIALCLAFHLQAVDVLDTLGGVLQQPAHGTHGHIDDGILGGDAPFTGGDEDVAADGLGVPADVCQGLIVHLIEVMEEGAEHIVFVTDEAQHVLTVVDALAEGGGQEVSVPFQDGGLVADTDTGAVEGGKERRGKADGFRQVPVIFVGAGLLLDGQYIVVAIAPGLGETEHLFADGVTDKEIVVRLIMVLHKSRVSNEELVNGIVYFLPFLQ